MQPRQVSHVAGGGVLWDARYVAASRVSVHHAPGVVAATVVVQHKAVKACQPVVLDPLGKVRRLVLHRDAYPESCASLLASLPASLPSLLPTLSPTL